MFGPTRFRWPVRALLVTALATVVVASTGALSRPDVALAACTDGSHSGALVPAGHVGSSLTVRVWTTTDTPVGGSADIIRPNGTLFGSQYLDFGPKTPGGYYFAPVTWTPGTAGTWKVKYSIQMSGCPVLQTHTVNVPVS
jgi:hypothetical protein